MNQSFKKKVLVASITAALTMGVVSVPAYANIFADTTQVASTTAGVTVPVASSVSLGTQILALTETVASTVFNNTGTIVLTLDNGKWAGGTTCPTLAAVGGTVGSATCAVDSTGKKLTLTFTAAPISSITTASTLKIGGGSGWVLDTTGVAVGTAINVTVDASSTLGGLTTGTSTKLATTSAAAVTITNPTAIKAASGTTVSLPTFSFTESITGSVGTTAGAVKLTLKNGYTWGSTKPTLSVSTNSSDATLTTTDGTATGSSSTVASYKLAGVSTGTAKTAFSFGAASIFVGASATSDIVATLTVLDANQNTIASQDITLGSVVAKGLTSALSQVSGQTGTDVLFTGRNYAASALTKNTVNVKENVGEAVSGNSTYTLTLDDGATWTSDGSTVLASDPTSVATATTTGFTLTFSSISSTNKAQASYSVSGTDPSASAHNVTYNVNALSTVGAKPGNLNLTVGSNSAASAPALKIATVQDATSASVSGAAPTVLPGGAAVALPDVVITESAAGALLSSGQVALRLPAGVTYDSTVTPTVTVTTASGTTLTGKASANGYAANSAGTNNAVYNVNVTAQSTATDGPMSIKVSGLKVVAGSSATAGDLDVYIHGNDATAATTSAEESMTSSDAGAKPTSQTLKVATVVSQTNPAYPTVTVADKTNATIAAVPFTAAGNDQGKPGSVYVAFILGSQVYFMNSAGAWTLYVGTTPAAYFSGNLSTVSIDVIKTATNISSLAGGQLLFGYGLGLSGLSDPFQEMLRNTRYNIVYTVQ